MALTNIDKFIESLMWMWDSPETAALFGDLKLALDKQGLEYKDGKIIKSQRRVSAEAKGTGYDESEDEKIRKKLIHLVNKSNEYGGYALHKWEADEMLAWLEKQGKQETTTEMITDEADRMLAWLEKQSKQETTTEMITPEESLGIDSETYNKIVDECIYGEQKPVDKVEPKFKVGDFIKHNKANIICRVVSVNSGSYYVNNIDTNGGIELFNAEKNFHLWSIADAKDGDVLAAEGDVIAPEISEFKSSTFVAIYKEQNGEDFSSHCYIGLDGKFYNGQNGHVSENVHPATKEQCDLLFQRMHEAGYTFDFENKELKKLKFKVGDEIITENEESLTITRIDEKGYWSNDLFICDFDEECIWDLVGQKPADKVVGPKFKVGDLVVHDISDGRKVIRQIINMTNKSYILDGEDFNTFYFNDLENDYHLWTIQDAKPGDVLAFDDETIVIFKDLYNATTFHSYCHIEDGLFDVNKDEMPDWWEGKGFHPATKKQRDILFQKMHDAGYTFDFKKKELKKIHMIDEDKAEMDYCFTKMMNGEKVSPAWGEDEPQLKVGNFYECIKSYYYLGGGQYWFDKGKVYFCEKDGYLRSDHNNLINVCDCKNWQSCFRPYPYAEKSVWSEEDEQYLLVCKNALRKYQVTDKWDSDIISQWLDNKLKPLRPQPKQEWSKEDRDYYDAIIAKLEVTQEDAALTDNQMEFLKSLKQRIGE